MKCTASTLCTTGKVDSATIIFGCGNALMGDDGFGPAVIECITSACDLPVGVSAIDAGTGVRDYLFDYLLSADGRPDTIIIVDAVDFPERRPGDFFRIDPADIPARKIHDFSLHQFPTVNLLQELAQYTGIRVIVLAVQIDHIPQEISPGLSPAITAAVDRAYREIRHILGAAERGEVTGYDV